MIAEEKSRSDLLIREKTRAEKGENRNERH